MTADAHVPILRNDRPGHWVVGCSCPAWPSMVVSTAHAAVVLFGGHAYDVGYSDGAADQFSPPQREVVTVSSPLLSDPPAPTSVVDR